MNQRLLQSLVAQHLAEAVPASTRRGPVARAPGWLEQLQQQYPYQPGRPEMGFDPAAARANIVPGLVERGMDVKTMVEEPVETGVGLAELAKGALQMAGAAPTIAMGSRRAQEAARRRLADNPVAMMLEGGVRELHDLVGEKGVMGALGSMANRPVDVAEMMLGVVPAGAVPRVAKAAKAAKLLKGDKDLRLPDFADEVIAAGGQVDEDGFVRLFHRTTPEKAEEIRRTGQMVGKEDGIFFSTSPVGQVEGYGESVVEVRLPLSDLQIDDLFDSEAHLRLPLKKAGDRVKVEVVVPEEIPMGKAAVEEFGEQVLQKHGLADLEIYEVGDDVKISMIAVPKDKQRQGIGSAAMQDIVDFADQHGKRLILTPGEIESRWGRTSTAKLKEFYKQFGFVENKGQNKDFRIKDSMYRAPQEVQMGQAADLARKE